MTRYRCYACGRRLIVPGLAIGDGRMLGPTCAKKPENLPAEIQCELSATAPKKRQRSAKKKKVKKIKQVARNDDQFDLFSG